MGIGRLVTENGVLVHGTIRDVSDYLANAVLEGSPTDPRIFTYVNVSNFYLLSRDSDLRAGVNTHCIPLVEGIGMRFGARLRSNLHLPRFNQTDAFPVVMDRLNANGVSIFLFGGTSNVVEKAASKIDRLWPQCMVAGLHHGFCLAAQEATVAKQISQSRADLVLVGRGFGLQERFSIQFARQLGTKVIWNVGGLFDFLSGAKRRAPASFRALQLEWLYRLWCEPQRLWPRTLLHAPWFLAQSVKSRISGRCADSDWRTIA